MPVAQVTTHLRSMVLGPLADRLTVAGVTVGCLFDDAQQWDGDGSGDAVPLRVRTALIVTGSLPGLMEQVSASLRRVDTNVSTTYTVYRIAPEDDGLLTRVWLA